MQYSKVQVGAVAKELQKRFMNGEVESHELVVTLLAMEGAGRITPTDMKNILLTVFFGDTKGVIAALKKAAGIVTPEMIAEIIAETDIL